MPNLSSHDVLLGQNFWESSATQKHKLGTRGYTEDGRAFRYCLAGAADLVAGNVIQGPAITANHLATVAVAASIGATAFSTALGATLASVNQYAEGFAQISDGPGAGYSYTIQSHPAIAQSGTGVFTLLSDDPIQVALTTASRIGLIANPYRGVIQMPQTTATGSLVGVAPYVITAAQYGWIQTWGPGAVLINGTPALGAMLLGVSATTAGAVDIATAAPLIVSQILGTMMQIGVSTKINAVDIRIRP